MHIPLSSRAFLITVPSFLDFGVRHIPTGCEVRPIFAHLFRNKERERQIVKPVPENHVYSVNWYLF